MAIQQGEDPNHHRQHHAIPHPQTLEEVAPSPVTTNKVRFRLWKSRDLEEDESDTDFITPTKSRQKASPPRPSPPEELRKGKVLDLKVRAMMLEIKDLTYEVEEGRTEMRLFKDKINVM